MAALLAFARWLRPVREEIRTIEEIYEPFLIQSGFLNCTPRGRMATSKAFKTLKIVGIGIYSLPLICERQYKWGLPSRSFFH